MSSLNAIKLALQKTVNSLQEIVDQEKDENPNETIMEWLEMLNFIFPNTLTKMAFERFCLGHITTKELMILEGSYIGKTQHLCRC